MPDFQRKEILEAEIKIFDESPCGSFAGYASVFGNLDRQGEIVCKGAFADTLPGFLKDGFAAVNHEWSTLPIATISEASEDEHGLFVKGEFHSTPDAQLARTVVRERLERGKSVGMSIGYKVGDDEFKEGARLLKKLDLFEVSLVSVPANASAQVLGAKEVQPPMNEVTITTTHNPIWLYQPSTTTGTIEPCKGTYTIHFDPPFPEAKGSAGSWDTTDTSFRYRVRNPGDFEEGSFRTKVLTKSPKTVTAVMGKLKGESAMTIQSLIFSKDEWDSIDSAKAWVSEHFKKDGSEILEAVAAELRRLSLKRIARRRAHRRH